MPMYEFKAQDGDVVERWFPMAEAPEIGSIVEDVDWGSITRIPSGSPRKGIVRDYACVAHSLPRVYDPRAVAKRREREAARERDPAQREALLKSAEEWRGSEPIWKKVTPEGKPVFETKRDVEEFQARTGNRYGFNVDVD